MRHERGPRAAQGRACAERASALRRGVVCGADVVGRDDRVRSAGRAGEQRSDPVDDGIPGIAHVPNVADPTLARQRCGARSAQWRERAVDHRRDERHDHEQCDRAQHARADRQRVLHRRALGPGLTVDPGASARGGRLGVRAPARRPFRSSRAANRSARERHGPRAIRGPAARERHREEVERVPRLRNAARGVAHVRPGGGTSSSGFACSVPVPRSCPVLSTESSSRTSAPRHSSSTPTCESRMRGSAT